MVLSAICSFRFWCFKRQWESRRWASGWAVKEVPEWLRIGGVDVRLGPLNAFSLMQGLGVLTNVERSVWPSADGYPVSAGRIDRRQKEQARSLCLPGP
jgi:hypothetical protein